MFPATVYTRYVTVCARTRVIIPYTRVSAPDSTSTAPVSLSKYSFRRFIFSTRRLSSDRLISYYYYYAFDSVTIISLLSASYQLPLKNTRTRDSGRNIFLIFCSGTLFIKLRFSLSLFFFSFFSCSKYFKVPSSGTGSTVFRSLIMRKKPFQSYRLDTDFVLRF